MLGGCCSRRAENAARGDSVLLAAARFRCLSERVGTTYPRFYPLDDVESIGATIWPLREPAPRRQVLAMATQDKYGFQGGASRPDPGGDTQPEGETPQSEGGGGQNAPKTGPNSPKMRFGVILDHLEAIGDQLGPFGKV